MRKLFEYKTPSAESYNGAFFVDSVDGWYYHSDQVVCVLAGGKPHKLAKIDFAKLLCNMTYEVIRGRE